MPARHPTSVILPCLAQSARHTQTAWVAMAVTSCTMIGLAAASPVEHRITRSGGLVEPGRPETTHIILALAEKELRLIWSAPAVREPTPVEVHRITDTRRVLIKSGIANAEEDELTWAWTPPPTRATVRYKVVLGNRSDRPVTIEVRDPEWARALVRKLALMEWHAHHLTDEETQALGRIGISRISISPTQRGRGPARLTARSRDGGGGSVRAITWDEEHLDLVVWRPHASRGDIGIRAPRWWISPEALATDHGLIRFLDLYSEPPLNP